MPAEVGDSTPCAASTPWMPGLWWTVHAEPPVMPPCRRPAPAESVLA